MPERSSGRSPRNYLVFCDPDRSAVKAMGLTELPAFVFTRVDGAVAAKSGGLAAEGVGSGR